MSESATRCPHHVGHIVANFWRQLCVKYTPTPIAARRSGYIQASVRSQAEIVLHRRDSELCICRESGFDQIAVNGLRCAACDFEDSFLCALDFLGAANVVRAAMKPAYGCVVVVRARVTDAVSRRRLTA